MKTFIILFGLFTMLAFACAALSGEQQNEHAPISILSNFLVKGQDKTAIVQALLSALIQHDQEMAERKSDQIGFGM